MALGARASETLDVWRVGRFWPWFLRVNGQPRPSTHKSKPLRGWFLFKLQKLPTIGGLGKTQKTSYHLLVSSFLWESPPRSKPRKTYIDMGNLHTMACWTAFCPFRPGEPKLDPKDISVLKGRLPKFESQNTVLIQKASLLVLGPQQSIQSSRCVCI